MAKVKEQVKFNPSWSEVKRLGRTKKAIAPENNILTIILILLAGVMVGFLAFGCLFDPAEFIEDGHESVGAFAFSGAFMLLFVFALNTTLPATSLFRNTEKQQAAAMGGCVNMYETFMHMPMKKVTLYKQSFRHYAFFMIAGSLPSVILNGAVLFIPELAAIKGIAALTTILYGFMLLAFYFAYFGVFNMSKKTVNACFTVSIVLFYVVLFGCMFGWMNFVAEIKFLTALAGIPSICITVLVIAAIFAIEKLYLEKREANGAWDFSTMEVRK
ncbi:MAG: hypothetical protein IJY74_01420 [Oscillospiraceae bacterium]|nr:hypothetical protein [Oscillospiraceae bacterium]